ncbi:OmpP1/FadL family transporter [Desulforhabdus amnigena]|uniref:Fatty acid transporter n=1 Tax=Desulforhabdus amnigena TaxID=40218 RepID=A0A9W6FU16_9BACT|nr:outer membrane protein transport protein [Desulforhabdus amnigena]NLJ27876.1 hypothetical protein [Deltaproteobacteria bacterium]GLI34865.1 fatty acid transporter [Desulforhabdus amnigena]
MKSLLFCTFALGIFLKFVSGMAWAGGLIVYENDSPTTGTASAGWAALADDASTSFTNPAGMTRLDRSQLLVGAQPMIITSEFNSGPYTRLAGGGGEGGNAGGVLPSLGGYYVHSLSDCFKLGIGSLSYFGAAIDYGDTWVGRYRVEKSTFLTAALSPSAAYRVNDWFSVGAMFNVVYGYLSNDVGINNLQDSLSDGKLQYKDEDFGFGGGVGVLFEPTRSTRLGVTYYSPVDLTFTDTPSFENTGPILTRLLTQRSLIGSELELDFTIPQWIMMSLYQQVNDKLAFVANFGWQDWSEFGDVDISLTVDPVNPGSLTANLKMQDTYHFALGGQYRIAQPWLLSLGFAYDTSPLSDANRSASLPLDRNIRYAAGIQYDWNKNLTLGLAYEYIDLGSANLAQLGLPAVRGTLQGDYDPNNINVVNLNLVYRF